MLMTFSTLNSEEPENLVNDLQKVYKHAFDLDISKKIILHQHTIGKYLSSEYLFIIDIPMIEKLYNEHNNLSENNNYKFN